MTSKNHTSKFFEEVLPTLNKTGFMSNAIDPFSREFIAFSKQHKRKALEIGTAYGVTALEALSQGVDIVCNDKDKRHLMMLKKLACQHNYEHRLHLSPGSFPDQLHFDDHSFDAILIARVLHLFDGDTIRQSLSVLSRWLKPGGHLFVVADTPYLKNLLPFIPIYEKRVANNALWPGFFKTSPGLVTNYDDIWPTYVHLLDTNVLRRELTRAGFYIEKLHTISRPDFPEDRILDGREGVGAVAVKV